MRLLGVILLGLLAKTQSDSSACKLIGQTGYVEIAKDGDLLVGGIFTLESRRKQIDYGYKKPPIEYCSEYVFVFYLCVNRCSDL